MQTSLRQKKNIQIAVWIRGLAFAGLLSLILLTLAYVENLLVSFVIALVINYMLAPVVNLFERKGLPKTLSTVVAFLIAGALVTLSVISIIPFIAAQFAALQSQFPSYVDGTTELISTFEQKLQMLVGIQLDFDMSAEAEKLLLTGTKSIFEDLPTIISKFGTTLLLAPFFAFFIVKDGRSLTKNFLSLVPNNVFELALNMYYQINRQMGQFVRARLLEALFVGLVVWVGLWIIDFPFATLLAVFAGVTNLIPYLGPLIGAVPAIIIALISGTPLIALSVALIYTIAQIIDVVFIIPLVVAKLVNLHAVTVVVVILIGAQVLGILGMIISIPVASVLKVIFTNIYKHLVDFRA